MLSQEPAQTAVADWHRRSGGNPFLAAELIRAGSVGTDAVPDTVERDLQTRLRRLGDDAAALARAAAILGPRAELRLCAELAGLEAAPAARAADRLVAAGLIAEVAHVSFVHALIAEAVTATIPAGQWSLEHRRAARLLEREGAGAQRIAVHLAAVHPAGDDWASAILADAAATALAAGAPQTAARLLRRALAEPAPPDRRPALLLALGRAEVAIRDDGAPEHLRQGREALAEPSERARVTQELALDLRLRGRVPEAVEELRAALAELSANDRELGFMLKAQLAATVLGSRETLSLAPAGVAEVLSTLAGDTPGERMMLAAAAFRTGMAGGAQTADASAAARRALSRGLLDEVTPGHQLFVMSLAVLYLTGAIAEAERWAALGIDTAQRAGSVAGYALTSCFRAEARRQAGWLDDAEADARAAAAPGDPRTWPMAATALGFLVEALVERGALDDAQAALERSVMPAAALDTYPLCRIRLARGKLALARGDHQTGLARCPRRRRGVHDLGRDQSRLVGLALDRRSRPARRGPDRHARWSSPLEDLALARETGVPRAIGLAELDLRCDQR